MSDWLEFDQKNIWHPFTSINSVATPVFITSGEGIYLVSNDGRKIIDGISSWWVNLHGHAHPKIARALAEQAATLEHVIFAGFTHGPAITLSENLLSMLPASHEKIFFSDNGSTSVEVALKMSIQYWKNLGKVKKKIVAFNGAYHGDTFGSMSVADRGLFTKPFHDYLFEVNFIDLPVDGESDRVRNQFEELVRTGYVGVFIFEPLVQAAAGMRMYSPEALNTLLTIARDHEVVTIADEVFTGFGRTGKTLASDFLQIAPDIICLSKGITGGTLPLGVTSVSTKVVDAFRSKETDKTFFHGHSYTANPLACAAANASFELLTSETCQKRIRDISVLHENFARKIKSHRAIDDVRTLGTILAIELSSDQPTSYTNDIRTKIYDYFLARNILLRPLGNVLYVLPPYVITDKELFIIYTAIEEFIDELK